jgi:hypothetical protein
MDGANVPSKDTLRKFGFLDVNTALANTVQAIQNAQGPLASSSGKKDVTCEELTAFVKEMINEEHQQLKITLTGEVRDMQVAILAAAREYTDRVTNDLGDRISLQFEELISNIKTTQQMLKGPNQRLALSNSSQKKLN